MGSSAMRLRWASHRLDVRLEPPFFERALLVRKLAMELV